MVTLLGCTVSHPAAPPPVVTEVSETAPGDGPTSHGLPNQVPTQLTQGRWLAVRLDTTSIEPLRKQTPCVEFLAGEGRVRGSGGCNRFSATYVARTNGTLDISQIAATKRLCPEDAVERAFFRVLERADGFQLSGDTLYLADRQNSRIGTFIPDSR